MSEAEIIPSQEPRPVVPVYDFREEEVSSTARMRPDISIESPPTGMSVFDHVKRKAQQAIVAAEVWPATNEGSRYVAFAASEVFLSHNPLIGAAVMGGSTLLVEGAGALAATNVLTDKSDHRLVNWLNRKIQNVTTGRIIAAENEAAAKAALAYHAGTPALLTLEQAMNPDKPRAEVQRRGLFTAAWLAGVFAVEGTVMSETINQAHGLPQQIAGGVVSTAALAAVPYLYNRVKSHFAEEVPLTEKLGVVKGATKGLEFNEDVLKRLSAIYNEFRNENDEAVKIGLYGEDLEAAFNNPGSSLLEYQQPNGIKSYMPLLVPAESLEWYNMDLLKRSYGDDKEFYYYAHPPLPGDEASQQAVQEALKDALDKGAVIFTDEYTSSTDTVLSQIAAEADSGYVIGDMGADDKERHGKVFASEVTFDGVEGIRKGPTLYETYEKAIASGEITEDLENGVALHEVITGEDAEKIWQIYDNPFATLSEEHPMHAGFDKEQLLGFLADPSIAKIVRRADGEITTLVFFQSNFTASPWFNADYYKQNYPEYYDTGNILIFPGIVTDETKRNASYAVEVINLATQIMAKRNTNCMVTFECTEISAKYIPRLVSIAINHSEGAHTDPIKEAVSTTVYRAIQKA